jgi:hypothetical protein
MRFRTTVALLAALGTQAGAQKAASGSITINAYDYFYEAPNPIAAGLTTIKIVNKGKDAHHVWIVKLDEGYAFSDFMSALGPGRTLPKWTTGLGGPEVPTPGQDQSYTVMLEPGRYAIACILPAMNDHATHMSKGMFLPLTVTKGKPKGAEPKTDATVTSWTEGVELPATLKAGKLLLRVSGLGKSPTGVRVAKLNAGKTAGDAEAWVSAGATGTPPFTFLFGNTPISAGVAAFLPVNFTAGNYVFLATGFDPSSGELTYIKAAKSAAVAVQ